LPPNSRPWRNPCKTNCWPMPCYCGISAPAGAADSGYAEGFEARQHEGVALWLDWRGMARGLCLRSRAAGDIAGGW
jgi:hypothetical protein